MNNRGLIEEQPRMEYPRPQFQRKLWLNLNGIWEFEYDDSNLGQVEKWYSIDKPFSMVIQVPFVFQSGLSGIGETVFHDVVWYRRNIIIPDYFAGKRILLHFGAVDYSARVWVNGQFVTAHEGGHTPFCADITNVLTSGENSIVVRVEDFSTDVTLPRGKQYWGLKSESIFYTRTTGIWQTVWLEAVNEIHIEKVKFTPDIDSNHIKMKIYIKGFHQNTDIQVKAKITYTGSDVTRTYNNEDVTEEIFQVKGNTEERCIQLQNFNHHGFERWWWPERPNLYDVRFTLTVNGKPVDEVTSYFGMRKISIENGKLCLNNRPYFMKLVLDQGYFQEGVLTAPSDEAIKKDIELTKAMGFNGARKHQKIEDPRYLYWCDQMGLLVWGEMANAYDYSDEYVEKIMKEWLEAIDRDYNHPCLVAWVPLNESWGIPNVQVDQYQQNHAASMYYMTKSLDLTRLVISNDGWEHVKSDLCTIHDYEWRQEKLKERYSTLDKILASMPANRRIYVGESNYQGEPILVSEFGGIAYKKSNVEGWGYSGAIDGEDFLNRLKAVVIPLLESPVVQGFCYTQLTDVEQEINGLLTYDRVPKVPVEKIKAIIDIIY